MEQESQWQEDGTRQGPSFLPRRFSIRKDDELNDDTSRLDALDLDLTDRYPKCLGGVLNEQLFELHSVLRVGYIPKVRVQFHFNFCRIQFKQGIAQVRVFIVAQRQAMDRSLCLLK